ncbi:MAG TPA: hypothetical protein VFI13_14065 [Gemmatimonadales bacterium]|nr:hypothetical protein [Gemmatimonadales bacterium]
MNAWRRIFGLDVVNTILVAIGSGATVIMVGELTGSGELALGAMVVCLFTFGMLRHYALKSLPPETTTSGAWRMGDVEDRLAELEALHTRVAELEERVDFNERLLAQTTVPRGLEVPK